MARSIVDDLMERRAALVAEAEDLARRAVAHKRDLSVTEQTKFDALLAEAKKVEARAGELRAGEQRAHELEESFGRITGRTFTRRDPNAGQFADWAREARVGDSYDIAPVPGAEQRARHAVIENRGIAGVETRAMSASGGVAPDGVYGQLWQYAVAASQVLKAGATVINTADGNVLPMPVATVHATTGTANSLTPAVIGANAAITANDATITTVNLSVSKYGYLTLVPTELVQDASFDLEGYLSQRAGLELGRTIAKIASTALVTGYSTVGVAMPTGCATSFGSATTANQGSDIFVSLLHSVLPEYRAMGTAWLMADSTLAAARNVKSGTVGQPLLVEHLNNSPSPSILGSEVYIDPSLPIPAASAKTVYFGAWNSLAIRLAGGIRFERSNDYAFGNDQIAFRAIIRCGAVVLDPNAVKFAQHSAT